MAPMALMVVATAVSVTNHSAPQLRPGTLTVLSTLQLNLLVTALLHTVVAVQAVLKERVSSFGVCQPQSGTLNSTVIPQDTGYRTPLYSRGRSAKKKYSPPPFHTLVPNSTVIPPNQTDRLKYTCN